MSLVQIKEHVFDVDLIVFDKDGTLIGLDIWGHQLENWGGLLQERLDLSDPLIESIYSAVGYDAKRKELAPNTPVVVATIEQLMTIVSFLLFRSGIPWTAAEEAVRETARLSVHAPPTRDMLELIGDVPGTFQRLRECGVRIAIATSDDRLPTETTVELLGLAQMIEMIVCATDPIPKKPAPDGLLHISQGMDVPVSRMLMVGDSMGDMQCGRAADVAGCIQIDPTGNNLATISDVSIRSVDEIQTVDKQG